MFDDGRDNHACALLGLPRDGSPEGEVVAVRLKSITVLWLAAAIVSLVLLAGTLIAVGVSSAPWLVDSLFALVALPFLAVGTVLLVRLPKHPVSRLLVGIGVLWALAEAAVHYLLLDHTFGPLPLTNVAVWIAVWIFGAAYLILPFLWAVFPSGEVTAWLRWPVRVGIVSAVTYTVALMLLPTSLDFLEYDFLEGLNNPVGIPMLEGLADGAAEVVPSLVVLVMAVLVAGDLVLRWRRSTGVERLQMRWFGFGLVVLAVMGGTAFALNAVGVEQPLAYGAGFVLAISFLPVSIGVAISRYRLFEIERIVSRTVSYALVAGALATVFTGVVLAAQAVLPAANNLAVAASTLAVAALFNPLRRRTQTLVDRRFNRSQYDSQLEMARLAERLDGDVGLDQLAGELLGVVANTLQPTAAAVWIRGES